MEGLLDASSDVGNWAGLAVVGSDVGVIDGSSSCVCGCCCSLCCCIANKIDEERNITQINFDHPLYKNVFLQRISNFQYPRIASYFKIRTTAPKILSLQGESEFLVGLDGIYLFTAAISNTNSNF